MHGSVGARVAWSWRAWQTLVASLCAEDSDGHHCAPGPSLQTMAARLPIYGRWAVVALCIATIRHQISDVYGASPHQPPPPPLGRHHPPPLCMYNPESGPDFPDSPRFVCPIQRVAGLNIRKRHFMCAGSLQLTDRVPQCHSCMAVCALVLFVNGPTVTSGGRVCCLFGQRGSDLTVVTDLGGSQQALFAERHPHLSTDDKL